MKNYPECSGNPSSCPENEGYGCCQPNPKCAHPPIDCDEAFNNIEQITIHLAHPGRSSLAVAELNAREYFKRGWDAARAAMGEWHSADSSLEGTAKSIPCESEAPANNLSPTVTVDPEYLAKLQQREISDNYELTQRIEESLSYFCDEFPHKEAKHVTVWTSPISYHCGGITPNDLQSLLSILYAQKPVSVDLEKCAKALYSERYKEDMWEEAKSKRRWLDPIYAETKAVLDAAGVNYVN